MRKLVKRLWLKVLRLFRRKVKVVDATIVNNDTTTNTTTEVK
jgi:hypothetical protein